jgi:DNA-binding transcriptional LysR family regulator
MRIDAIRSFIKLVEAGSYTAAAAEMYMSITTVHSHVSSLEKDLATQLVAFERGRLELTHAGNLFLVFAERTLAEYDWLRNGISNRKHAPVTSLRIASLPSLGIYVVPPAVRAFVEQNPNVRATVDTRRTGEALATIASGQADLAIVLDFHAHLPPDEYDVAEIMDTNAVIIVRKSMDIDGMSTESVLGTFPWTVQPPSNLYRRHLERWAAARELSIDVRFEHSSHDGIVSDVLSGDYIGLINNYVQKLHHRSDDLKGLLVPGFSEEHKVVALYPKRTSSAVLEFVRFLPEFCRQLLFEKAPEAV